jgi:putative SOS response-associated peptidase YedK
MCGRFCNTLQRTIFDEFDLPFEESLDMSPEYNIAPTDEAWVIDSDLKLKRMKWGLVPENARHNSRATSMINARSEDLLSRPSYKKCFDHGNRCLIPCNGFYEFPVLGGRKRAFRIHPTPDDGSWLMAGLFSNWVNPETGGTLSTFTILTTRPNSVLSPKSGPKIHDRMPVIIHKEDRDRWFKSNRYDPKSSRLEPWPSKKTQLSCVNPKIRNSQYKNSDCHELDLSEDFDWLK